VTQPASSDHRCDRCGYQIATAPPFPRCPMCGSRDWKGIAADRQSDLEVALVGGTSRPQEV
jgi:rubredoxin